ncbi:tetratricopeptide repeat protein [Pedobacter sp. GSP4]|uniref:tetratricopeptide repeat protein n=1 Tax=Pedobacter sp. GSP4 TaxID=3453716 RepID=UPI003EE8C55C
MKKLIVLILLTFLFLAGYSQSKDNMDIRFFTKKEFNSNYSKEKQTAQTVYKSMLQDGFKDNALAKFDFDFISDRPEKLDKLSGFLRDNYGFKLEKPEQEDGSWILRGNAETLPYTEENLIFWVIDLYCKGYEFDCKLDGYGALTDPKNLTYLDMETEMSVGFYEKGLREINQRNFGKAIIYFSTAINYSPKMKEAWQARGYCKDELYSYTAARRDYDEALQIDPDYIEALLIRATNKDDAGEYNEAMKDYNRVIELEPANSLAYYNRGNTKFNLNDKQGACADWEKAKSLGDKYAQKRIDAECK